MASRAARRRHRLSPVALVVTLVCLVVVGWAVRGLLQDPVPATADFGPALTAAPTPEPPAAASPQTSPSPLTAPSAATGSTIPEPGRAPAALPKVAEVARPTRLAVPSVGLEVSLEPVSVDADGQMEIPEQPDRAGWYRHGPPPGSDAGSVVVAAHVDTTSGPGAFLALTDVEEGDEVEVELDDGTSTTYRIVGGEQVAKTDLPVEELFRRDGDPVLRLVTCTGDWSPRTGRYTDNLVVSAVPVG